MNIERPGSRSTGSAMPVVFLLLLALVATLSSGCVSSVPLPGPGDGGAVFVHPVTGEVKHCEDAGMPANFRGGVCSRLLARLRQRSKGSSGSPTEGAILGFQALSPSCHAGHET